MAMIGALGTKGGLIAGGAVAAVVVAGAVVVYQARQNTPPEVGATAPVIGAAPQVVVASARTGVTNTNGAPSAASSKSATAKTTRKTAPKTAVSQSPPSQTALAVKPAPKGPGAAKSTANGIRLGAGGDQAPSLASGKGTQVARLSPEPAAPRVATTPLASPGSAAKVAPKQAQALATPTKDTAHANDVNPPKFDLVRIDKRGSAVVAGKASPGSVVEILMDGKLVTRTKADALGGFVALFDVSATGTPRIITLLQTDPNGRRIPSRAQVVVIAPKVTQIARSPGAKPKAETSIAALGGSETTAGTTAEASAAKSVQPKVSAVSSTAQKAADKTVASSSAKSTTATETASATSTGTAATKKSVVKNSTAQKTTSGDSTGKPASTPGTPSRTALENAGKSPVLPSDQAAPTVVITSDQGVRVLQPPALSGAAPEVMANVSLDLISYDDKGEVVLSGRSKPDRHVRVYVDDKPIKTEPVAKDGSWQLKLPEVDAGRYTLRVDELDSSGKVTSRLETPFQKEKAEKVVRLASADAADNTEGVRPQVQKVTIQRGNTLWALAKKNYGKGVLYMQIFNANRQYIRDPDLIYPGQIFTIPK